MKKFLLLFTISLSMAFISDAQISLKSLGNGLTKDTVVNTATETLVSPVVSGYRAAITIQVDITKISGTLGGSLVPVASNDGVTFYDISTTSSDTLSVANSASQGKIYSLPPGYRYYGVQWTGTGTMSGSFVAKLNTTKP